MRRLKESTLQRMLERHKRWLDNDGASGQPMPRNAKGALARRAEFFLKDLTRVNFSNQDWSYAVFQECDLDDAEFWRADLQGTYFDRCDLPRASFVEATCYKTRFDKCRLRDANFSEAYLIDADLTHAMLQGAIFSRADLFGTRGNGNEVISFKVEDLDVCMIQGRVFVNTLAIAAADWSCIDWNASLHEAGELPSVLEMWQRWHRVVWQMYTKAFQPDDGPTSEDVGVIPHRSFPPLRRILTRGELDAPVQFTPAQDVSQESLV